MMPRDFTIIIPAKNAASTIARAVRSAVAQRPVRILLVDHASEDRTTEVAHETAAGLLELLEMPGRATLGEVRQAGLDGIRTEYGMWLDADDELLPGRATRLLSGLQSERADLAFDEIELCDGDSESDGTHLPIPAFLRTPPGLLRLFERNYLPGPGVPAFRTETARAIGFDSELHGAEDFDFVLRAVVRRVVTLLVHDVGYRQFPTSRSLSRRVDNQRRMCGQALRKHDPKSINRLFEGAGCTPARVAWAMVSFFTFRQEYEAALVWLERVDQATADRNVVLEPMGPEPFAEGWRLDFYRGTLLATLGRWKEATDALSCAVRALRLPEALNNLGVALASTQQADKAHALFAEAARLSPGYVDALTNRDAQEPARLTRSLLRRYPVRADYPLSH